MSSVFDTAPVSEEAESLDVILDSSNTTDRPKRKFHCEAGTYRAVISGLKPFLKNPEKPKVIVEVTLTDPEVAGIRASRFFDLSGKFTWMIEKMALDFGIPKVKNDKGQDVLPLTANKNKLLGAACIVEVAPRQYFTQSGEERVNMDFNTIKADKGTEKAPF